MNHLIPTVKQYKNSHFKKMLKNYRLALRSGDYRAIGDASIMVNSAAQTKHHKVLIDEVFSVYGSK